ncbi:MAG: hypothetical protein GY793_01035, partial [Proteobacteria bacterium]|nr:hypothetical protein [Pseudomonadota bacterium]
MPLSKDGTTITGLKFSKKSDTEINVSITTNTPNATVTSNTSDATITGDSLTTVNDRKAQKAADDKQKQNIDAIKKAIDG